MSSKKVGRQKDGIRESFLTLDLCSVTFKNIFRPSYGERENRPPPVDRPLDNQLNACLIHYRPTLTWSRLPRNSAVNPVADASIHEAQPLATIAQGPDLQNILRQSYDYLTIMPKLRSTYDRFTQNILQWMESFSRVRFTCQIVISSEITFVN